MWRGNSWFRSGISLAFVGALSGAAACGDDEAPMDDGNNRGGSSGTGGAGAGAGGAAGSVTGGSAGSVTGGTSGAGGNVAGSGGSGGSGGTGGEGGDGGEGALGGEGGEAGTTGGTGGAGMGGKGGAGSGGGGAGSGGAGSGGGGAGSGGAGSGGGGAGSGGAGSGGGGAGSGGAGSGGTAGGGAGGTGGTGGMPPMIPNLYFSEYVEGNTISDAFEIFNATNAAVSLNGCEVRVHYQAAVGSTAATLMGSLPAGDVYVMCLQNRISTACDVVVGALADLSGDDAVELVCPVGGTMTVIDVLGRYGMGFDPGAQWGTGANGTQNNTLRRNCAVTLGDRNATNLFNPATQWTGFGADNVSGLGARTCPCPMVDLTCP